MINGIPFYLAYLTPILAIITANFVVMILTFRKVFEKSAAAKSNQLDASKRIRIVVSCSILMGITWILGVFAIGELRFTFQILFTIFNSLQGLFIFVFYCALNKEAVNEWKRLFGISARDSSSSTRKSSQASTRKRKLTQSSTDTCASRNARKSSISAVNVCVADDSLSESSKQEDEVKGGSPKRYPICGYKKNDTDGMELIHIEIEKGKSTA